MHLYAPAEEAGLPHALGHALAEHPVDDARVLVAAEVTRRGRAVAYALDDRLVPGAGDGRRVIARGEVVKDEAPLAEETAQHRGRCRGDVAYGVDAAQGQLALRRTAHAEQICCGQRPDLVAVVLRREHGDGVGLFVIRAELGEDFVPGRADGNGDAQLELDALAYLICKRLHPALAELLRPGDVAPDFVEAEGLHEVGVVGVDLAGHAREAQVAVKVRRHDVQLRAFLFCLPERLAGLDAVALGDLVFRQYYPMPRLHVPAHRYRQVPYGRVVEALDGGIAGVHVNVQHRAHELTSSRDSNCIISLLRGDVKRK